MMMIDKRKGFAVTIGCMLLASGAHSAGFYVAGETQAAAAGKSPFANVATRGLKGGTRWVSRPRYLQLLLPSTPIRHIYGPREVWV